MDRSTQFDDDALPPGDVLESARAPDPADPTFCRQLQRIEEYRSEALDYTNNLHAAIGAANAGLLEVELHVATALRRALAAEAQTTETIAAHAPTIELQVRLLKQIPQLCNLEASLKKASEPAGEVPALPIRPK